MLTYLWVAYGDESVCCLFLMEYFLYDLGRVSDSALADSAEP